MAGRAGKRVYQSREWRAVRAKVFKRDGFKCVKCGRRGRLECDHIKRIRDGGDWFAMDNLQTLCRGCSINKTSSENRAPVVSERQQLKDMAHGKV